MITDIISFTINDSVIAISEEEAVALRDSLCARLGCPSFCCSETITAVEDGSVKSNIVVDSILTES